MTRSSTTSSIPLPPEKLGAYSVLRMLAPDSSYLCLAEGGRHVVLKKLESDCLLRDQLHPSIKERLMRVRELAQKHVATLQTVERIDFAAYLVWEYVDGRTFEEYVTASDCTPNQLALLARELILSVEALHAQGIVHGCLHGRNIIVDNRGQLYITHVSPLLYTDPTHDTAAIVGLLKQMIKQRALEQTPLGDCIARADAQGSTLRQLAARLAVVSDVANDEAMATDVKPEQQIRRRALIGAAIALVVGIVIVAGIYVVQARSKPVPTSAFERLDSTLQK